MFSESKTDANESLVLHPEAQHSIFIKSIVRQTKLYFVAAFSPIVVFDLKIS